MSEPNYVTCLCQHCSGHIKFDANLLRKDEFRRVECPHCHLETVLYIPNNTKKLENQPREKTAKQTGSSKSELALFQFTRFITLFGAILVFAALVVTGILIFQTLLPEKPEPIHNVSYESVAPLPPPPVESQSSRTYVEAGSKMAGEGAFPQPVAEFLLNHKGFSLKEWLVQLKTGHRKPFLDNLAAVIVTAKSKQLSYSDAEQVVKDCADQWIALNEKVADPNAVLEKRIYRASCISVAFGLFIALTILCLILVLLAIERNTRLSASKLEAK